MKKTSWEASTKSITPKRSWWKATLKKSPKNSTKSLWSKVASGGLQTMEKVTTTKPPKSIKVKTLMIMIRFPKDKPFEIQSTNRIIKKSEVQTYPTNNHLKLWSSTKKTKDEISKISFLLMTITTILTKMMASKSLIFKNRIKTSPINLKKCL